MKKTNTKTLTLYLLSFIGILVIALFLMNYYGILDDISDNVNWKVGERVSADGSNSVWLSEPFGELDMRVQIKEYDAGYENGMQFLKKTFRSADGSVFYQCPDNIPVSEYIENLQYDNIHQPADYFVKGNPYISYRAIFVPLSCDYIMIGDNKFVPVEGKVKVGDGIVEFKTALCYYKTTEYVLPLVLYDYDGNKYSYDINGEYSYEKNGEN